MKIEKYAHKPKELIKEFESLYTFFVSSFPGEIYVDITIELSDEDIQVNSIDEFKLVQDKVNNSKVESFHGLLGFNKVRWQFHCRPSSKTFSFSIYGVEYNIIEQIFDEVFSKQLKKCKIYKYDIREESTRARREIVRKVINLLKNFNDFQIKMSKPLVDEKALQEFAFPILKSHFTDLEDEFHLPRFGTIEYKPDFGIPEGQLLIEFKFVRVKGDFKKIQKEIIEDATGYLKIPNNKYKDLIVFIYNSNNAPIDNKFKEDLEKIGKIVEVIIVPGINPDLDEKLLKNRS